MTISFEATFKRAFQISDNPFQNLNQNKIKYRITIVDTMKSTLYDLKFQSYVDSKDNVPKTIHA